MNFRRRNVKIASQKLSWSYFLGAVILTGDLKDFRPVISGDFGPLGEVVSGTVT